MSVIENAPRTITNPTTVQQFEVLPDARPVISAVEIVANDVRENGDIIDRLPWMYKSPLSGATAKLGAFLVGACGTTFNLSTDRIGTGVLTAGVVAASVASKKLNNIRQRRSNSGYIDRLHDMQGEVGLPIEIYTTLEYGDFGSMVRQTIGKRVSDSTQMRLYTTDDQVSPKQLATELTRLTDAASRAQVDKVTLPLSRVDGFIEEDVAETAQTHGDWLGGHKTIVVKDNKELNNIECFDEQLVVSLTVDQLKQVTERLLASSLDTSLASIMDLLQKAQPNHPVVREYNELADHPKILRERLKKSFWYAVERRLDDTIVEQYDQDTGGTMPVRMKRKTHLSGRPELDDRNQPVIEWQTQAGGTLQYISDLLGEKKLTQFELNKLLANADHLPSESVAELCELAGWLHLNDVFSVEFESSETTSPNAVPKHYTETSIDMMAGLQERTYYKALAPKRIARRIQVSSSELGQIVKATRAFLAIGLTAIAGGFSANTIDRLDSEAWRASEGAVSHDDAAWQAFPLHDAWTASTDFMDRNWYTPISNVVGQLGLSLLVTGENEKAGESANDLLGRHLYNSDPSVSEVGNVSADDKNQPVWWIAPQNGMDSSGYWTEAIESKLDTGSGLEWSETDISRNRDSRLGKLIDSRQLNPDQPALKVSMDHGITMLSGTDMSVLDSSVNPDNKYYSLIQVPILEGTRIAAVNIKSDRPGDIRLIIRQDGQQLLAINGYDYNTTAIEYWLVPDKEAPVPKANLPLIINDGTKVDVSGPLWEKHLGRPMPADPADVLAIEESTIRESFTYSLSPIKNIEVLDNTNSYVESVLQNKEANCNVASTLLAISNPDQVAPVIGFYNSNTAEQKSNGTEYLSSHEAHMWTIDAGGKKHDATPRANGSDKSDFFAEDFDNRQPDETARQKRLQNTLRYLGLTGVTLAAGLTLKKRRVVKEKAVDIHAGARLRFASEEDVIHGHAGLNHALFAAEGTPYQRETARVTFGEAAESLDWYADTLQLGGSSVSARSLKRSPLRRDVRRGKRLVKAMQRIRIVEVPIEQMS